MDKIITGKRSGARQAFLDMSGRFKPKVWGGCFRMGDRAAAYLWVAEWRKRNPNDRILIIDDPLMDGSASQLDAVWLFGKIVDEIWIVTAAGEAIAKPNAYPLYHTNLWRIWLWLRKNKTVDPDISPKPESMERARQLLRQYSVPEQFITLQPLFDAKYNQGRNAPIPWWQDLTKRLSKDFPVVLLGTPESAKQFGPIPGTYPLWQAKLSPMDSLALISLSAVHLGGETGLTLWASLFKRPTIALYSYWRPTTGHFPMDCRPLPCGAPVEFSQLGGSFESVPGQIRAFLPVTVTG